MIRLYQSYSEFKQLRVSGIAQDSDLTQNVAAIIERVRLEGDTALRQFTKRFDGVELSQLRIPREELQSAADALSSELRTIFSDSIENVQRYHEKQIPDSWQEELPDGSMMGMQYTPVGRVGCYVPGGRAGYPSTVIMTVVPAQIAGVEEIIIVSPPDENGMVDPVVMAMAGLLNLSNVFAVGGAQAIAALTYGTESLPRVDKIVGPGNIYVNEAKRQVYGTVGIDSLAGPSEVVILADETADADYVVKDLFAQAEHDEDARTILVTTCAALATAVQKRATELIVSAARQEIIEASLQQFGAIIMTANLAEAITVVNDLATEHLQIMTESPEQVFTKIKNAGAVFLGQYTPVATGDYCAGPNHVLPTLKNATFSSPLNVLDFMKFSSVMRFSEANLIAKGPAMAEFAQLEGLLNHKQSIACRYE
jgi:histidinol dehydrogenase